MGTKVRYVKKDYYLYKSFDDKTITYVSQRGLKKYMNTMYNIAKAISPKLSIWLYDKSLMPIFSVIISFNLSILVIIETNNRVVRIANATKIMPMNLAHFPEDCICSAPTELSSKGCKIDVLFSMWLTDCKCDYRND